MSCQVIIRLTASGGDGGFAAAATLAKRLKEEKISELQILEFRRKCCTMLGTIVAKIQERSTLKHLLVKKLASLDQRAMGIASCRGYKDVSEGT